MSKTQEKLIDDLSKLTVIEAADLAKALEEKWGVTASAPVAAVAVGPAEAAVEEKTNFTVVIEEVGDKKLQVIKAVKEITALGLKESKGIVDGDKADKRVVKADVPKSEAEEMKKKLEDAGAKVELK